MARQEVFNGMELPHIPELTKAGLELREIRRQRMELTKQEVAAADRLIMLLHENKLTEYRDEDEDPPVDVKLVPGKEKVRVKLKVDDEKGDED